MDSIDEMFRQIDNLRHSQEPQSDGSDLTTPDARPRCDFLHNARQAVAAMGLGAFLLEMRNKRGVTQRKMGDLLGTTQVAIFRIESGRVSTPSLETLTALMSALGLSKVQIVDYGDSVCLSWSRS